MTKRLYDQFKEATRVKERTVPLVKVQMHKIGSPTPAPEVKKNA